MERLDALSRHFPELGFTLDLSAMGLPSAAFAALAPRLLGALDEMAQLEAGAVANADEQRMVGHYWLRAPELAPSAALCDAIVAARARVAEIAATCSAFTHALVIGIGGSSLGPQLVFDALGGDGLALRFLDNTDPDGFERQLAGLDLDRTLVVVISKSGGTKETQNGMCEVRAAYDAAGVAFGERAIAVTGEGSALDRYAEEHAFRARLPMWDWIGGRSSVTSAVGLLPAALQGADCDALLAGARAMDAITRRPWDHNPAALLAATWWLATGRDMVMLPYKDRLALTSRYLQQLVMESIGKRLDRAGAVVHAGITVYGNKGSTDQHAYVQQLLDGPDDFFVTFIEVLRDRDGAALEVEPGVTSGDYLSGFLQGTRKALSDRGRPSLTLTFERVDARAIGALIALYERAVGLYASLANVNAYHQPAVESGKKAAAAVLALQARIEAALAEPITPAALAARLGADPIDVFYVLRHLAHNGRARAEPTDAPPWHWRYGRSAATGSPSLAHKRARSG